LEPSPKPQGAVFLRAIRLDPVHYHLARLIFGEPVIPQAVHLGKQGVAAVVVAGGTPVSDQLPVRPRNALRGHQRKILIILAFRRARRL
jgi:hypothetical protein